MQAQLLFIFCSFPSSFESFVSAYILLGALVVPFLWNSDSSTPATDASFLTRDFLASETFADL